MILLNNQTTQNRIRFQMDSVICIIKILFVMGYPMSQHFIFNVASQVGIIFQLLIIFIGILLSFAELAVLVCVSQ